MTGAEDPSLLDCYDDLRGDKCATEKGEKFELRLACGQIMGIHLKILDNKPEAERRARSGILE